jgi:hypothetical protein
MPQLPSQPRKPGIFLSHSHADKSFARRLAADLRAAGAHVWLDEAEIQLGDSLIQKIQQGIDEMDYLAVVLSPKSVASPWVQREVEIALNDEMAGTGVKVLPLLYQICELPGFLKGKFRADFTSEDKYQQGLDLILVRLGLGAGSTNATESEAGVDQRQTAIVPQNVAASVMVVGPQLDDAAFENEVLGLLRANDDIALRMFINDAVLDAGRLVAEVGRGDDLLTLLDRLTCLVAIAITFDRPRWRDEGIKALTRIYNLGFDDYGVAKALKGVSASQLWLSVIERVMALGALCVRLEKWDGVRALVLRPRKDGESAHYGSWIRHAHVMAARDDLLKDGFSRDTGPTLIKLGQEQVRLHPCLRPDVDPESDFVIDSVCQFDFLSGITALGDFQRASDGSFYPSFACYYARRTEPLALALIDDFSLRKVLFPHSDALLAQGFVLINELVRNSPFWHRVWHGFRDERIAEFIRMNLPEQSGA